MAVMAMRAMRVTRAKAGGSLQGNLSPGVRARRRPTRGEGGGEAKVKHKRGRKRGQVEDECDGEGEAIAAGCEGPGTWRGRRPGRSRKRNNLDWCVSCSVLPGEYSELLGHVYV